MKRINISKDIVVIIFILAFLGIGIYAYFTSQYRWIPITELSKCPIEYGNLVCMKGKPRIPFFNPNDIELTNIQVVIQKSEGIDIYQVNESLKANEVKVLTLLYHNCSFDKKMKELRVKWCCGECYDSVMRTPSQHLTVNFNDTYD